MLGKKARLRRIAFPATSGIFILVACAGAYADNNFQNELFSLFEIEGKQVATQGASITGAFNADGWIYSTTGVASIDEDSQRTDLVRSTKEGGLCVGDCDEESVVAQESINAEPETTFDSNNEREEVGTTSTTSTSTIDSLGEKATSTKSHLAELALLDNLDKTATTSSSSQVDSQIDSQEINSFDTSYSRSTSGGSSSKEEEISSSTASSSASSTVDVEDRDNENEEGEGGIEHFLLQLKDVIDIGPSGFGIGMDMIDDFALAVHGWIFSTQGIIVGVDNSRVGLGVTEEGVCLGSCDFVFEDSGSNISGTTSDQVLHVSQEQEKESETFSPEDPNSKTSTSGSSSDVFLSASSSLEQSSSSPLASSTENNQLGEAASSSPSENHVASSSKATSSSKTTSSVEPNEEDTPGDEETASASKQTAQASSTEVQASTTQSYEE